MRKIYSLRLFLPAGILRACAGQTIQELKNAPVQNHFKKIQMIPFQKPGKRADYLILLSGKHRFPTGRLVEITCS